MKNLLFLLLLSLALPVSAKKVTDLYEAEVAVQDQSAGHREVALKTAMRTVLIKITGDRYAPQRTSLASIIEQAGDYLQQYRYTKASDQAASGDSEAETDLKLRVTFDEATLSKALRQVGVPIWGNERPTTLVWVAVEDGPGRRLISFENDPDYIRTLDEAARRRGLAVIFPLMDLQDNANLGVSDVWGGFDRPVMEASRRYHADTILVGKVVSSDAGIWEGQWTSYVDNQTARWRAEGVLPDMVLDEGIGGHADILASRFAGSTDSAQTTRLPILVNDITTADHYARVLKYLRSLSSVTDVQVESVEPGRVRFVVTAHGGEASIRQAIALGRLMEPVNDTDNGYRLVP